MNPIARRTIVICGVALAAATPPLMDFLGKWEGRAEYTVYADKLAGGLPTVCKGLTRHITTTPIIVGERWSPEKCEAEEESAVLKVQAQLSRCFKIAPPQSVLDMATSHAWNLGAPSTCSSGAMAAFNRGEWEVGCRRLSRGDDGQVVWSFTSKMVNGKKVLTFRQGLANRRAEESDVCAKGWS